MTTTETDIVESGTNNTSTFTIDRHLIAFICKNAFFAEVSRYIKKIATLDVDTCCVSYNSKTEELSLKYNPIFFGGGSIEIDTPRGKETIVHPPLTNLEIQGAIEHEFYHVTFGHISWRRPDNPSLAMIWNISCDLAEDSLIVYCDESKKHEAEDRRVLPRCALVPGRRPYIDQNALSKLSDVARKNYELFANWVAALPINKASEFYFNAFLSNEELKNAFMKLPAGDGGGDDNPFIVIATHNSFDSHDEWDEIPDDKRHLLENTIRCIVEKAVNAADKNNHGSEGWGNIPCEIQAEIRRSTQTAVDWAAVLRQFVGSLIVANRHDTVKRINRKYPYIHPGSISTYYARLLIAIDQSGSVSDEKLEAFFGTLLSLTKKITVDIIPFDADASESDIFEWKKGTTPELKRVRCGGTNFNAPTSIVNDPKNHGRWNGMLILTDGQADKPEHSRVKRGWVLGEGDSLYFDSDELQVFIDNEKPMIGAWR